MDANNASTYDTVSNIYVGEYIYMDLSSNVQKNRTKVNEKEDKG